MDYEILWDFSREVPTAQDKTMASMAHEDPGAYLAFEYTMNDHVWPNRFHAMTWTNGSDYDDDLSTWDYWAAMAHDHHNTLAHISY